MGDQKVNAFVAPFYNVGDDVVNQTDANFLVQFVLSTEFGDTNLDQMVTFADFANLQANYSLPGGWADGDNTGDGLVSFVDFANLQLSSGLV